MKILSFGPWHVVSSLTIGCLALSLNASFAAPVAQVCNGLLPQGNISPRQLYSTAAPRFEGTAGPTARPAKMTLAYIIPDHPYSSGAVIVKYRHKFGALQNNKPLITLHRDGYRSPCVRSPRQQLNRRSVGEYDGDSDPQRYINYHRYGLPNSSLENLHADIGYRATRTWYEGIWYEANSRCANTSDWDIAPQFLFETNLNDREPLKGVSGFFEYGAGRVVGTYNAQKRTTYAAPASYTEYHNLTAIVLPYRKLPGRTSCIAFSVAVPGQATQTEVMIIDADDARIPRPSGIDDPQKVWRFDWQ